MGISFREKVKERSLFFAPMEGITDVYYRNVVSKLYPEWDFFCTDFLRISSVGMYPSKHIIKHFGESVYENQNQKNKTIYQILASDQSLTEEHVRRIQGLGFEWIDLNIGCPSKTVCRGKGGSYLLSDLPTLTEIIRKIRSNFDGIFTAKIRVGYRDDTQFVEVLKLLEAEGVDAITIHGRTRDELYRGVANWDYIKLAVESVDLPIIGNGDIWSLEDMKKYFDYTGAYAVMMARGALKTPWIAGRFKAGLGPESPQERKEYLIQYYTTFYNELKDSHLLEPAKLKRMKSVTRHVFDPFEDGAIFKSKFLRSKTKEELFAVLDRLNTDFYALEIKAKEAISSLST